MDFFAPAQTTSDEDLLALRRHWTAQRESYPGWIVSPYDNRERVWNYTKRWLGITLTRGGNLEAPEDLLLMFELNWRLERCMMPLFLDWVAKMAEVVGRYQPFGGPAVSSAALIAPGISQYSHLSWGDLTPAWVDLVFALAREAREDQDSARFEKWMALVEPSKSLGSDWAAKWHHEKCLFALMRLDRGAAIAALEDWQQGSQEPFWDARCAAIFAETGNLAEAERLAESALAKVRSRLEPFTRSYAALSQEGWIMFLLDAIRQAADFPRTQQRKRAFFSRWEELKAVGGNPWQEFELLKLAVSNEPPRDQPPLTRRRDFDPGRETQTRHMSYEPAAWESLPAFALVRLYEDGAVPLKCGALSMFEEAASNAADWIAPYAPLWALTTKIRAGNDKGIETTFTRSQIAALTPQQVETFYKLIKPPLEAASAGRWATWQEASLDLSYRSIKPSVELLSRLYFRLKQANREEVFALACRMYRQPLFRHDISLQDLLKKLFGRMIFAMTEDELLSHFGELLALPVPGEEFEVFEPQRWVEPTAFIPAHDRERGESDVTWHRPTAAVEKLLASVRGGVPEERSRAVIRLSIADSLRLLSDGERARFGDGLWARVDSVKGLPAETHMRDYSFLHLPEPTPGRAKEALAKYLLSREIPAIATHTEDGRLQYTFPPGADIVDYIEDVVHATVPWCPRDPEKFIDWSTDQAATFLDKIAKWWSDSKGLLARTSSDDEFDLAVRARFEEMLEVFAHVILLRLTIDAQPSEARRTIALLEEMENAGVSLVGIAPTILFADPGKAPEITEKIREGLAARTENPARRAIFAVLVWGLLPVRNKPPVSVPDVLIEGLVDRVFFRVQPSLVSALATVADLLSEVPGLFDSGLTDKLLIALRNLASETEVSSKPDEAASRLEDSVIIDLEERPSCRRHAARLAAHLAKLPIESTSTTPGILDMWREISRTDPLPEVRRSWRSAAEE